MAKKTMLLDISGIYQNVKNLAEKNGMSIYQLSVLTGYARHEFNKWKNGNHLPKVDTLWQIADIFGVSIDEIVGRKIPKKK